MMKTTQGLKQVDVVYRRIDDAFLDPLVFRTDSVLGVPGIFDVYRAGRLTIVNAPGAGIADDKSIYTYMPDIVEFYTGRPPILKNVPTYVCRKPDDLKYVLEHLRRAGGEAGARLGRLRHAGRARPPAATRSRCSA